MNPIKVNDRKFILEAAWASSYTKNKYLSVQSVALWIGHIETSWELPDVKMLQK